MNYDINLMLNRIRQILNLKSETELSKAINMSVANLRIVRQKNKLTWPARFSIAASIHILPSKILLEDVSIEYISSLLGLNESGYQCHSPDGQLLLLVRDVLLTYKKGIEYVGISQSLYESTVKQNMELSFQKRLSIIECLYRLEPTKWIFDWSNLSTYCSDSIMLIAALSNIANGNVHDSINDKVLNHYRKTFSISSERELASSLLLSVSQLGNIRGRRANIPLKARVKIVHDFQQHLDMYHKVNFEEIQQVIANDYVLGRQVEQMIENAHSANAA